MAHHLMDRAAAWRTLHADTSPGVAYRLVCAGWRQRSLQERKIKELIAGDHDIAFLTVRLITLLNTLGALYVLDGDASDET